MKPLDESKVKVYNPANGHRYCVKFVSVSNNSGFIPILGSKASQFMNILTLSKKQSGTCTTIKAIKCD